MSKPQSTSWLRNLPEEKQAEVIAWCATPKSATCSGGYKYAAEQIAREGVSVAQSTLSDFYSWYHMRSIFARADRKTTDFEELLAQKFPDADPKRIQEFGQAFFTMQAAAAGNPEEFREMEKLRLAKETAATKGRQEEKKLELAERRIQLLEENSSKAKEQLQKVVSKGGLSKETLRQIEDAAKLL